MKQFSDYPSHSQVLSGHLHTIARVKPTKMPVFGGLGQQGSISDRVALAATTALVLLSTLACEGIATDELNHATEALGEETQLDVLLPGDPPTADEATSVAAADLVDPELAEAIALANGDEIGADDPNVTRDVVNSDLLVDGKLTVNKNLVLGAGNSPPNTAITVHDKQTLWHHKDLNYFSWGYGGEWNRFQDEIGIGDFTDSIIPEAMLHLRNDGKARLRLEADWDNYNESHNVGIELSQDNNLISGFLGFEGNANQTFGGTVVNALLLGTDSNNGIHFATDGDVKMTLTRHGRLGIGTISPSELLTVNGTILAKQIIVENFTADFVFEDDYPLMPLDELETYIDENGHLPDIPNAASVDAHGSNIGETQTRLLQKIEELTLHVIAQNKRIEQLEATRPHHR